MKTIRLGYLSTMYHTCHILRTEQWIEQDMGLEPQWQIFGTGPAMVEAFQHGQIDMGYIGLPPAMIGIGKGIRLKCIAGGHVEGTVMVSKKEYAAMDMPEGNLDALLKKFAGKKIASPAKGSIHDVIIRHLLEKYSVNGAVINYPWADLMPEAIREGEVEAAVGTPPMAVLSTRLYGLRLIIHPNKLWRFNPSYGIVVAQRMMEEKQILKEFLTLHEKACNLIRETPGEAAAIIADEIKVVDRDFVKAVFSVSPRYCSSLPQEYIDSSMAFVPVLKNMGYLSKDVSQEEVFDTSLIESVHPEPHHY